MPFVVDGKTEWVRMDLNTGDLVVRGDDGVYRPPAHCSEDDACCGGDEEHTHVDPAEVVRMCKRELAEMRSSGIDQSNADYAAILEETVKRLDITGN